MFAADCLVSCAGGGGGVCVPCSVQVLMPLGELHKTEVRALAERFNLPSAKRKESYGICFVGKRRKFSGAVLCC